MNLKPIFDRVIIKPDEKENITRSGIVLPSTSQERPQTGIVVAIGEGIDFDGNEIKMRVKVKDNVLFNRYAGNEIKIDGITYLVLRQIDIIAIIKGEIDE